MSALSQTDLTKLATETAESFVDNYYTTLSTQQSRKNIASYYIPPIAGSTPSRNLPIINYNGDVINDPQLFQTKFSEMPWAFYDVQSLNSQIINPAIDPEVAKSGRMREMEKNVSIGVQVSGSVRLNERKGGEMRGFSEEFVLVPNKGNGRDWLIQMQNFRFVV
ncbi:hypothetical protein BST61_g9679 [Cercospora zeina]